MQNIDVRFNASSNFGKVKADLAALQAQAASLGAVFAQNAFAKPPALVDPTSWQKSTRAVHEASNAYRNAVSSSGLLTSQQIRATAESERYTKSLQKQKLAMGDMMKHRGIMQQAYQDQLRYQRMTAQYWGTDSAGRAITDITIPKNVPRDLDTVAQKIHFVGQMSRSAGTQIINMGKNMQWAGRQLMVGFTYPVALFGAAAGVMAYKVDEAMTQVTKVYDVSAAAQRNEAMRTKELAEVRVRSLEVAREAARKYGQSIEDTLGVEQALAATGLSGDKLFESTDAVSRIAALGDLDLTASTDMTVALQTAFKDTIKTTDDLNQAFDYMNAVENATSLSIKDIAEATPRAASAMSALGVTVEEMTVLLTSMREAGVNAAEGANALKSATGTILSPSPAAIEFIKGIAGNKIAKSMANLRESTGGNLYQAIKQIYELTENLSKTDRQAVLVKMFGKYQFNRVSAMVENLGSAFDGTQNQARKAMDLMGESSKELGDRAEKELGEKMTSAAGKFNKAWQALRIELAEVGKPFLAVATYAAEAGTKILSFFNGMADWKKKAILGVAAVMAIAGPIVMMGGLFMNLAGQFVNGGGKIMTVLSRMAGAQALVTKEEKAAILSAEAQNKAMAQSQTQTSTLAKEVAVLTAAYEKATAAARAYAQTAGVPVTTAAATGLTSAKQYAAPIGPQLPAVTGPVSYSYPRGASQDVKDAARNAAYREMQMAELKRQQAQEALNQKAAKEAAIREKIKNSVNGANLGMAAMGVGMAAMMLPLGEATNKFGQWLMIGSIVVPAMVTLGSLISGAAKGAWSMAAAQIAAAKAAKANAIATGATVGKFGALRAGATGLMSGIGAALGPGGVLSLGILAVGGAYYWAWNKGKEAREAAAEAYREQVALAKEVESSTRKWADQMGIVVGRYERVAEVSKLTAGGGDKAANRQQELIEYYKTNPEGEEDAPIAPFKSMDVGSAEFQLTTVQKFIDLQVEARLSAEEAAQHMRAFYIALGLSADEADAKAQLLLDTWGDVSKKGFDWSGFVGQQMDLFRNSDSAGLESAGKNAAEAFWAGMANAKNPEDASALVEEFVSSTQGNIQSTWDELGNRFGREWFSAMEDRGVTDAKGFAELLRTTTMEELMDPDKWKSEGKMTTTLIPGYGEVEKPDDYNLPYGEIEMLLKGVNAEQDHLLSGLNKIVNFGDDVKSVFDLPEYHKVQALTTSYSEAKTILSQMLEDNKRRYESLSAEEKIMLANIVNAYNLAHGIKQGSDYTKAMANFFGNVKVEAKGAGDEADNVKKKVEGIRDKTVTIRIKQVGGILQTAMGNIQQSMADGAMRQFNSGWDSRMDAAQSSWDARMDNMTASHERAQNAMDRRQENAQDAFDRRWEARRNAIEKEYDRKIERVNREIAAEQKADQIRQQLFEKEKARLAALAEGENTNIDFNTQLNEGNLDEAAKTLNNAGVASANAQMDAEQAAAEKRTEARIAALEKKNERLEKARDRELENLQKLEERMRKHLERVQDARRRALEKQQADEVKALEKSEEAAMASLDRQREYEEATLQQRLDLFLAYTARNKKDLERWMRELGFEYDDFGDNIEKKGEGWAKSIRQSLLDEIREAGTKVMNDNQWEKVGKGVSAKLLKGMGFKDMADFRRFVRTGEMGGGGKGGKGGDVETRHEGGMIGSGGGSRGNIPNTYKGLHRSEKMVRAQKGEYVINKNAVKGNLGILEAINKGADIPVPGMGGAGEGGYGGPAGLLTGVLAQMFAKGAEKAFQNNYSKGLAKQEVASGIFDGKAGTYGGRTFSAEQMRNAATIASVGSSMGMSSRDIMIGIMTAIAESGLINVKYGDRDSQGLFQQRPSMGWGTVAQITNPEYAARAFFGPLKAHGERTEESPWLAAQHIQRSAFADGSNYRVWWEAAQGIFKQGLARSSAPGGGYVPGAGGRRRPINAAVTNGLHGGSTAGNPPAVDMAVPTGRPVYAVADGRITSSRDIAGPLSSDTYRGDGPYGSFGRMITMQTDSGAGILYAHLSRRSVGAGQRVKGGSVIGYSGNTGNSSGPHLHFGATNGPYAWLRKGGEIKYDNTHVVAHRGETMLSAPVTRQLKENIASGGGAGYNVTIDLRGSYIKEDVDIEKAVNTAIDKRESKVGRKRVVK